MRPDDQSLGISEQRNDGQLEEGCETGRSLETIAMFQESQSILNLSA